MEAEVEVGGNVPFASADEDGTKMCADEDPYPLGAGVGVLMELEWAKRGSYSSMEGVAEPEAARFIPIAVMETHTHKIPPTTPTQINNIPPQVHTLFPTPRQVWTQRSE